MRAGSTSIVFAAWIVGGILTMFVALSFAELGAAIPEAAARCVFAPRIWPRLGIISGWMHSIVGVPASTASIAAGLLAIYRVSLSCRLRADLYVSFSIPFLRAITTSDFIFTRAQPLAVVALLSCSRLLIIWAFASAAGFKSGLHDSSRVASVVAIIVFRASCFPMARIKFSTDLAESFSGLGHSHRIFRRSRSRPMGV